MPMGGLGQALKDTAPAVCGPRSIVLCEMLGFLQLQRHSAQCRMQLALRLFKLPSNRCTLRHRRPLAVCVTQPS